MAGLGAASRVAANDVLGGGDDDDDEEDGGGGGGESAVMSLFNGLSGHLHPTY